MKDFTSNVNYRYGHCSALHPQDHADDRDGRGDERHEQIRGAEGEQEWILDTRRRLRAQRYQQRGVAHDAAEYHNAVQDN